MRARFFETLVLSRTATASHTRAALPLSLTVHALGVAVLLSIPFWTAAELPAPHQPPIDYNPAPTVVRITPRPTPAPAPPVTRRDANRPAQAQPPGPSIAVPRQDPDGPPAPDSGAAPDPRAPLVDGAACPECTGPGGPQGVDVGLPDAGARDAAGRLVVLHERDIRAPRKLRNLAPRYPELALKAHVQGRVVVECTIDTNGRIANARVVSGHPLLDGAALEAVGQWVYAPTLLGGVPVTVLMTVTVHFTLAR